MAGILDIIITIVLTGRRGEDENGMNMIVENAMGVGGVWLCIKIALREMDHRNRVFFPSRPSISSK